MKVQADTGWFCALSLWAKPERLTQTPTGSPKTAYTVSDGARSSKSRRGTVLPRSMHHGSTMSPAEDLRSG